MVVVAAANLALSLVLTPELGLEGPALATALPFFLAFPFLLRLGLRASGASLAELAAARVGAQLLLGALLAVVLRAVARVAGGRHCWSCWAAPSRRWSTGPCSTARARRGERGLVRELVGAERLG